MKISKVQIDQFYESKKYAVVGVSENKHKFGGTLFKELVKTGLDVSPVNPKLSEFQGKNCYASVTELPTDIDAIVISTKPENNLSIIKEAEQKGITQIWLQQGSENEEIISYAENSGANIIYKKCAIMFANPKGIHGFHTFLAKLFGTYPK